MIIQATSKDVDRILECAREFCEILGSGLDEEQYTKFWRGMLDSGEGVIFLKIGDNDEVLGGIGGLRHPDILSWKLMAVELFWYAKPEARGKLWPISLLRKFESWAKVSGCESVNMIFMQDSMPERLEEFYQRRGYRLHETQYRKMLH